MEGFVKTHEALARIAGQISPAEIPFLTHLPRGVGKFGKAEIELNAGGLTRFFQVRGGWQHFKPGELERYYEAAGWPNGPESEVGIFYGLAGEWFDDGTFHVREDPRFLRLLADGRCAVTDRFILRAAGKDPDEISAITREAA